jgi:hypothetical protein
MVVLLAWRHQTKRLIGSKPLDTYNDVAIWKDINANEKVFGGAVAVDSKRMGVNRTSPHRQRQHHSI